MDMSIKANVLGVSCLALVWMPACLIQEVSQRQPPGSTVVPDDMGQADMDMSPDDMERSVVCDAVGEKPFTLEGGEQVCFAPCDDDDDVCENDSECYIYDPDGDEGEEVVICECQEGTEGDLCDVCADGYEFVPNANPEESRCFLEEEVACSLTEALRCANRDGVDCVQFADLPAQCTCDDDDMSGECQPCAMGFELSENEPFTCVPVFAPCGPLVNDPCQNGGTCVLVNELPECRGCDEGYAGFEEGAGNFCTRCVDGFVMTQGECRAELVCNPECSNDKECVSGPQGMPVCECPEGTQDEDGDGECKPTCEVIFSDATSACDGRGTCMIAQGGPARGNPVCVCDDGYVGVSGAMSGPNCRGCASTHVRNMDNECVLREQCNGTSTCSGAGTCEDRTGFVECDCLDGYTGERCEMCESDYIRDANGACVLAPLCMMVTCPDNATCDAMTGMCMCDFGFVDDGIGGCQ